MAEKKSSQGRGREKVQDLMVDTKFDRLRTPAAKRLLVVLMLIVISMDVVTSGSVERYQLSLTFGQITSIIWFVLGSTMLIPNLILAWNQAKKGI